MPLIQIEQDSPAVTQIVRGLIAAMVDKLLEYHRGKDLQYGIRMLEAGYLGALTQHYLISMSLYDQLWSEQDTAYTDTLAEQAAKAG